MTVEIIKNVLLWCFIIDMGILLWWFLWIWIAHDWVYRVHTRWYKISVEKFDEIHYTGMGYFKIFIFVFNLVPYIALQIVT